MKSCYSFAEQEEALTMSYWEIVVCLPVIIILQFGLFSHSIHHEYMKRNDQQFQRISLGTRILFVTLQVFGLWWTITDLFRYLFDPYTHILRENAICSFVAFTPKIVPGPYYLLYLYQILLRLESSFNGSYLALSKMTVYILKGLVIIPIIGTQTLFLIVLLNVSDYSTCIMQWKPIDLPSVHNDDFSICTIPISGTASKLLSVITVWISIMNILFAIMFTVKLNKLTSRNESNEDIKFKFKSLIVKNCIVTIDGVISTIGGYALFLASPINNRLFLYSDLFINCMVIALMFKHNEKYYKRCCKCCIILFFLNCDKSQNKMTEQDVLQYVNDEIDLATIFNTSVSVVNPMTSTTEHDVASIEEMVTNVDDNNHNQIELDDVINHIYSDDNDTEIYYAKTITPRTAGAITSSTGSMQSSKPIKIVEISLNKQ